MKDTLLSKIIRKRFRAATNMSFTELDKWSKNPASNLASMDRRPIQRIKRLKKKPMSKWTISDYQDAVKVISYLARAKKITGGKYVYQNYTQNQVAMKNWGYDKRKK